MEKKQQTTAFLVVYGIACVWTNKKVNELFQ
jgi:hypothetical protein